MKAEDEYGNHPKRHILLEFVEARDSLDRLAHELEKPLGYLGDAQRERLRERAVKWRNIIASIHDRVGRCEHVPEASVCILLANGPMVLYSVLATLQNAHASWLAARAGEAHELFGRVVARSECPGKEDAR